MTDSQLRSLLLDCLALWGVNGRVTVRETDVAIETAAGMFTVGRAEVALRPIRWL